MYMYFIVPVFNTSDDDMNYIYKAFSKAHTSTCAAILGGGGLSGTSSAFFLKPPLNLKNSSRASSVAEELSGSSVSFGIVGYTEF